MGVGNGVVVASVSDRASSTSARTLIAESRALRRAVADAQQANAKARELCRLRYAAACEAMESLLALIEPLREQVEGRRTRLTALRENAADAVAAGRLHRERRFHRRPRPRFLGEADVDGLHRDYARSRDPELRDRLVESHAALAYGLASRFLHRGEAPDDLQQVALLALVNAVN